jgi:hypothetical protein
LHQNLRHHLEMAHLYGLLAMRYKYVDPSKHIHFYQKHLEHALQVDRLYGEYGHMMAVPVNQYNNMNT